MITIVKVEIIEFLIDRNFKSYVCRLSDSLDLSYFDSRSANDVWGILCCFESRQRVRMGELEL